MDFIFFVLLTVILVLLVLFKSEMRNRLGSLEKELAKLKGMLGTAAVPPSAVPAPKPIPVHKPAVIEEVKIIEPEVHVAPIIIQQKATPAPVFRTPTPPAEQKPGFFERHPDLEKFIGENLISKIGIAILVIAIGFFVKYAIDSDWIGPVGRVGIGLICGGILIGVAHYLRNSYKAFSSVLIGGGLAVFYFTISLAFHQFHLFSQTVSFIIMVVITVFAVVLSTLYDRQELAVIALIGGFTTPFIVSNGNNNYQALFIYLIVLNSGLLAIAYRKAWRLLNLLAFIFTSFLFILGRSRCRKMSRRAPTGVDLYSLQFFICSSLPLILPIISRNRKSSSHPILAFFWPTPAFILVWVCIALTG
jgi:uncharacterized membrane protein